jgi:hypothetical protein
MSELLGLGVADGESRWIGVRRHQAALAIAGVGLVGEWLTQVHGASFELVTGVAFLTGAVPTKDGLTVGERIRIALDFTFRPRWTSIRVTLKDGVTTLSARGEAMVRGFELQHHGRLDLSGRDQLNALALAEFADSLSTSDDIRHFSQHVCSTPEGVTTLLALPLDVSPPPSWIENLTLVRTVTRNRPTLGAVWMLERWAYLRDHRGVIRVLRVRDFTSASDDHALLERLQFASSSLDVVIHFDVVGGARANRLAARAVHRVGSDDVTSRAAGFRRTAQSTRALERLRQRESLVVEGSALMRIAVFIVIRADSLRQLRRDVKAVTRSAVESGLRCEPGFGRQALWYCAQLPGGPGW